MKKPSWPSVFGRLLVVTVFYSTASIAQPVSCTFESATWTACNCHADNYEKGVQVAHTLIETVRSTQTGGKSNTIKFRDGVKFYDVNGQRISNSEMTKYFSVKSTDDWGNNHFGVSEAAKRACPSEIVGKEGKVDSELVQCVRDRIDTQYADASEMGNGAYEIAEATCKSNYNEPDDKKAFVKVYKRARAGDVVAQETIGSKYEYGAGVQADKDKAKEWYLKAAKQGNTDAMRGLGNLAMQGEKPFDKVQLKQSNYEEALKWYMAAQAESIDRDEVDSDSYGYLRTSIYSVARDVREQFNHCGKVQFSSLRVMYLRQYGLDYAGIYTLSDIFGVSMEDYNGIIRAAFSFPKQDEFAGIDKISGVFAKDIGQRCRQAQADWWMAFPAG